MSKGLKTRGKPNEEEQQKSLVGLSCGKLEIQTLSWGVEGHFLDEGGLFFGKTMMTAGDEGDDGEADKTAWSLDWITVKTSF